MHTQTRSVPLTPAVHLQTSPDTTSKGTAQPQAVCEVGKGIQTPSRLQNLHIDDSLRKVAALKAMQNSVTRDAITSASDPTSNAFHDSPEISAAISGGLSVGYLGLRGRNSKLNLKGRANKEPNGQQIAEKLGNSRTRVSMPTNASEASDRHDGNGHSDDPTPAAPLPSELLRQALDSKYADFLKEENKASAPKPQKGTRVPKSRKKSTVNTDAYLPPVEVVDMTHADDDSDYEPSENGRQKRRPSRQPKSSGQRQKKLKRSSSENQHAVLAGSTGANGLSHSASPPSTSAPSQASSFDERNALVQSVESCRPGNGVTSFSSASDGQIHKSKKNADTLFGLCRTQILDSPLGRAETAEYAWSAAKADFAIVSTHAKFAYRAERIVDSPHTYSDTLLNGVPDTLTKLQVEFENIEFGSRGKTVQDAELAKWAGCADTATYAMDALDAYFAVEVGEGKASDWPQDGPCADPEGTQ